MDIHTWQKWIRLWPILRQFPREKLHLLDAGCGRGSWILRLAQRRPSWLVHGVDMDAEALRTAREASAREGNEPASFVCSDFLHYKPQIRFDVILSVASAHYLAEQGLGQDLFQKFREWLRPGGRLVLLAPRCQHEMPHWRFLPCLSGRDVFTESHLRLLCRNNGLTIERLEGAIGSLGALAKQLEILISQSRLRFLRWVAYPFLLGINAADQLLDSRLHERSVFFLLVARTTN